MRRLSSKTSCLGKPVGEPCRRRPSIGGSLLCRLCPTPSLWTGRKTYLHQVLENVSRMCVLVQYNILQRCNLQHNIIFHLGGKIEGIQYLFLPLTSWLFTFFTYYRGIGWYCHFGREWQYICQYCVWGQFKQHNIWQEFGRRWHGGGGHTTW